MTRQLLVGTVYAVTKDTLASRNTVKYVLRLTKYRLDADSCTSGLHHFSVELPTGDQTHERIDCALIQSFLGDKLACIACQFAKRSLIVNTYVILGYICVR